MEMINILAPVLTSTLVIVYLIMFGKDKLKKLNKVTLKGSDYYAIK